MNLKYITENIKYLHKQLKIYISLNILDLLLTYIAFTYTKPLGLVELSPIYSYLFSVIGILGGLLLIKILGSIIMILLFNDIYPKNPKLTNIFMTIFNIIYILIVINNTYINTR